MQSSEKVVVLLHQIQNLASKSSSEAWFVERTFSKVCAVLRLYRVNSTESVEKV